MANIVAIVGRPNVGKSTLFNRLTESRDAIVDEIAGVTRDRHYGKAIWREIEFSVMDTGGYTAGTDDIFEEEIRKQVELAIDEATAILFVVDAEAGIADFDLAIAQLLRKSKKPVFVVANKVDTYDRIPQTAEFYRFGLGDVYSISAANGSQTGDLLDALVDSFPVKTPEEINTLPRIAVVGRPNVGKSSLINALMGVERNIVTPISGTTRDAIDTHYNAFGYEFMLVDTAGIRKRAKVKDDLEFYSVLRTYRAIEESDVCIMMLDATLGMEKQDLQIYFEIEKQKKGVVVLVNKWDLVEKETQTMAEFEKELRNKMQPFTDVPIVFTSTITKQRIHKAVETAMEVYQNRTQKIPTSKLNEVMLDVINVKPPPALKGKYVKIKYCMQLPTHTPSFAFFCNLPQYVKDPYKRFLENKLRQHFDFTGVPINVFFRKK
ncbi:MAG TPA: ribosome biogenesis GTPase Der [Luteibaculaceae bacterium]|nr:ribosome biogenesis GTPase Der [Luteibaculaceae bacterium]